MVRQIAETATLVNDYGLRTGTNPSILFAHGSIFVGGQLLRASRAIYDGATELGALLLRCGVAELTIAKDARKLDIQTLAQVIVRGLARPAPQEPREAHAAPPPPRRLRGRARPRPQRRAAHAGASGGAHLCVGGRHHAPLLRVAGGRRLLLAPAGEARRAEPRRSVRQRGLPRGHRGAQRQPRRGGARGQHRHPESGHRAANHRGRAACSVRLAMAALLYDTAPIAARRRAPRVHRPASIERAARARGAGGHRGGPHGARAG